MTKINYKTACRIMYQGQLCEVLQLFKDMAINSKNTDGSFRKISAILDDVSHYFTADCSRYSKNLKEIFPLED